MTSSKTQAAAVAAGLKQDAAAVQPLSLDEWRQKIEPWLGRRRMSISVVVGELELLIERCEDAEQELQALKGGE